ncbi:hypothetical protein SISNIDRAFT_483148 [Sistotremastrum niveocremeum HHB9708]|uniref:Uncharacterized protein n=1 Tax=Sistotremastrum niveocremeum HHB9708 TaxID=1314777 RepID=A0A164Y5A8_9AGAM|nr:hypothetical protein SISNIDRAFT_483148 [Sistotremastrum niveocremeum HHB9708]
MPISPSFDYLAELWPSITARSSGHSPDDRARHLATTLPVLDALHLARAYKIEQPTVFEALAQFRNHFHPLELLVPTLYAWVSSLSILCTGPGLVAPLTEPGDAELDPPSLYEFIAYPTSAMEFYHQLRYTQHFIVEDDFDTFWRHTIPLDHFVGLDRTRSSLLRSLTLRHPHLPSLVRIGFANHFHSTMPTLRIVTRDIFDIFLPDEPLGPAVVFGIDETRIRFRDNRQHTCQRVIDPGDEEEVELERFGQWLDEQEPSDAAFWKYEYPLYQGSD